MSAYLHERCADCTATLRPRTKTPCHKCGCTARAKTWRYRKKNVRLADGSKTSVLGTPNANTKEAAEAAEREHILRVQHPDRVKPTEPAPEAPRGSRKTVSGFAPRHLAEYKPAQTQRTRDSRRSLIDGSIVPYFGRYPLDAIDQSLIDAFVRSQLSQRSTRTINRKLTALSVLLRHAHKLGELPELRALDLFIKEHGETVIRAFEPEEIVSLLKAAPDQRYRVAVLLGADAGLRIGEIRGAQWADIKAGVITLRRTVNSKNTIGPLKNKGKRSIKLSPRLREELDALPKRGLWILTRLADDTANLHGQARKRASAPGGFLGYFGMLGAMHRMMATAGIAEAEDVEPWHSLRHHFGTQLAASGAQQDEIQTLMGHADYSTTERYITTTAKRTADAIDRAFGR